MTLNTSECTQELTLKDLTTVGILPPKASFLSRFLAFTLDFVLVFLATSVLLGKFILPQYFLQETELLVDFSEQFGEALRIARESKEAFVMPEISKELAHLLQFCHYWFGGSFLSYFFLNELLMKGSSIGKAIFSLKVIKFPDLRPLTPWDMFWRSVLKTFSLFHLFPICLFNFLFIFFTVYRQAGHDLLCRTVVIKIPPLRKLIRSAEEAKGKRPSP